MIEEKDILNYLDGNSSPELRERVEAWIAHSPVNEEEFEFTKMMWEESSAAKDYVQFDLAKEWEIFENTRKKNENPTELDTAKEIKVLPLSQKPRWTTTLSAAASLAALIMATWFLWPQSEFLEIVNASEAMEVELADGSIASLTQGSSLRTKRVYKYESERNVDVEGEVTFDVISDSNKPFIVATEESAVEVLGTIFNVKTEGIESEVANEEGLVKFFVIADPQQFVTIEEGEVFKYDGEGFVDMNEAPPVLPPPLPPAPPPPKLRDILQYLRVNFGSRISFQSGSYSYADRELDIEYEGKSIREIIRLMEEKAIVTYLEKGCASCIEFIEIIPRRK